MGTGFCMRSVLGGLCLAALPLLADPVRFGVISDTHVSHDDPQTARTELGKVLAFFREQKVDAVIHCGDLTNLGYLDEIELFAEIWKASMPTSIPLVATLGNRDLSDTGRMTEAVRKRDFDKLIRSRVSEVLRKDLASSSTNGVRVADVRGVKVITADWRQTDGIEAFLNAHPECRDPRSFMVCVQHRPPTGLAPKLQGWAEDDPVTCALNMYPNVISFSGHSHTDFAAGRQFARHYFTAAGTGCHYLAAGPDHERREVSVLTLDGNAAELVRRDLRTGFADVRRWSRDTSFDVKPLKRNEGTFRFVQWNAYAFNRGSSEARQKALAELGADWIGVCEFSSEADGGKVVATDFGGYPSAEIGPRRGSNCNAVFARWKPVAHSETHPFATNRTDRYWTRTDYDVGGRRVAVFQTHLDLNSLRKAQIAELVKAASSCPHAIVAGDFNVEDLSEYAPFAEAGFAAANGGAFGTHLTHRKRRTFYSPAVDNVLVRGFRLTNAFTFDDACRLSDHRMLVADFTFGSGSQPAN